jgi:L-threonylcarbamoyladenylate synthase
MESTVIDVTINPPVILRIGGLIREDIEKEIGETRRTSAQEMLRRSPGTRHRHYAPKAHVFLIPKNDREAFVAQLNKMKDEGKKVGAITYSENINVIDATKFHLILSSSIESYAKNIFRALRELDNLNVDCMLVESVEEKGIGAAIMDRLIKAAQNI